jgi:hypothetical protein
MGSTLSEAESGVHIYRIDAADYIRYVNPACLKFAGENHGAHLVDRVLGTSLWSYLRGLGVRAMYRDLLDRLRNRGQRLIQFPVRCDSPTRRRYMHMVLSALPKGGIEFQCHLVREESRRPVEVLDADSPRGVRRVVLCAWCRRVQGHGEWMELEEALRVSSLFDGPHSPCIDHDICSDCKDLVK